MLAAPLAALCPKLTETSHRSGVSTPASLLAAWSARSFYFAIFRKEVLCSVAGVREDIHRYDA